MSSAKLFSSLASIATVNAAWGLGRCSFTEPDLVENFERDRFGGEWKELYVDVDHYFWSKQECSHVTYKPYDVDDMTFTRRFTNSQGDGEMTDAIPVSQQQEWFRNSVPYATFGTFWPWDQRHHQILETDYDNFAVIYGCDNYFGLFHGRFATLLSREIYLETQYVDKAVKVLREHNYDTSFWWINTGEACGFEAAKSYDQQMIATFESMPEWTFYNEDTQKTQQVKALFDGTSSSKFPTGWITGPLTHNELPILTPMKNHIMNSKYDEIFYMLNIAYDSETFGTRYVDFFILTEGLSQEDQDTLNYNQYNMDRENPPCCWDFVNGQTFFKDLATGYARIIVHDVNLGILSFQEGHFHKGEQLDFGRFVDLYDESDLFQAYGMYTGWIPDTQRPGLGISAVDDFYFNEGEWAASDTFPTYGHDLIQPQNLTAHSVTDLRKRKIASIL